VACKAAGGITALRTALAAPHCPLTPSTELKEPNLAVARRQRSYLEVRDEHVHRGWVLGPEEALRGISPRVVQYALGGMGRVRAGAVVGGEV